MAMRPQMRPVERMRNSSNRYSRVVNSMATPPRWASRVTVSSVKSANRRTGDFVSPPRRPSARTRAISSAITNGFGR